LVRLSLFKRSAIRRLLNVFVPSKVKWPERKKEKKRKKENESEWKKSAMHRRYVDASANHSLSSFSFTLSHLSTIYSFFISISNTSFLFSLKYTPTQQNEATKKWVSSQFFSFSMYSIILSRCIVVVLTNVYWNS
jgi:hypothetical protein